MILDRNHWPWFGFVLVAGAVVQPPLANIVPRVSFSP